MPPATCRRPMACALFHLEYADPMATTPQAVIRFENWLAAHGMPLVRRLGDGIQTGTVAVYSDGHLAVRVEFDRGVWMILVADARAHPDIWYDPALLREALGQAGGDAPMLEEQVAIVKSNWDQIRGLFESERRTETHARLDALRKRRVHRLFPGW